MSDQSGGYLERNTHVSRYASRHRGRWSLSRYSPSSLLKNLVFKAFGFEFQDYCCVVKNFLGPFYQLNGANRNSVSCSGHQVSQSAEVVSGPREGKQPPNFVDPSQL